MTCSVAAPNDDPQATATGGGAADATGGTPAAAGTAGTVDPTGGGGGATGGSMENTGGTSAATGGLAATGGAVATGGTVATGGSGAAGGTVPTTGGTVSTGGASTAGASTGGTSTGGASTGGTSATGGSAGGGTGGSTGGEVGSGGNIEPTGPNLITNGDFSDQASGWKVTDSSGVETDSFELQSGALCVSGANGALFSIGWPADAANAVSIAAGESYRFSFRLNGNFAALEAKVGGVYDPWTTVYSDSDVQPSSEWTDITRDFTPDSDEPTAGLVFNINFSGGATDVICVDDVSFVQF